MEKEFVPHEQALDLRDLGFDSLRKGLIEWIDNYCAKD